MREKDFVEALTVIGNEVRVCTPEDTPGLVTAGKALISHAQGTYPQIDIRNLDVAWARAIEHGWPQAAPVSMTSQERFGHPAVREPECIHSPEHMKPGHPMSACSVCRHSKVLAQWIADWKAWYEANPDHPLTRRYGPKVLEQGAP